MDDEDGSERVNTSKRRRAFQSLNDHQKAIEYHEKYLKIKKSVIGQEKARPMEILVVLMTPWVTTEKALIIMKNI